jgi:hypothetical protein
VSFFRYALLRGSFEDGSTAAALFVAEEGEGGDGQDDALAPSGGLVSVAHTLDFLPDLPDKSAGGDGDGGVDSTPAAEGGEKPKRRQRRKRTVGKVVSASPYLSIGVANVRLDYLDKAKAGWAPLHVPEATKAEKQSVLAVPFMPPWWVQTTTDGE